jgi:Predicted transcription factor, homolog of eukaryotic MBF1
MDTRRALGLQIRMAREGAGLSQEELAHRSKIHVTYLSGLENGKRNPSFLVLARLATALELRMGELFGSL